MSTRLAIVRRGVLDVGEVDDEVSCVSCVCHLQYTRRVHQNERVTLSEVEFQRLARLGIVEPVQT